MKSLYLYLIFFFCWFDAISQKIVINEIIASNSINYTDEDGEKKDWIEIYNYGTESVNLKNYGLSDNFSIPFKWVFPDITLKAGEYLIIFASGKNKTNPKNELHTNFSINSEGEEIVLTHPKKGQISIIKPTKIPTNMSFGRKPDGIGELVYFVIPTPNTPNVNSGFKELLLPPQFSHNSGFFTNSFYLKIKHQDPQVIIRYTLDGSIPTDKSAVFPDSLLIFNRTSLPNQISAKSTTTSNSMAWCRWITPMDLVFKCTNLRVRAFKKGALNPYTETKNYFVDKNIYSRYDIPILSISINQDDLFGKTGIFMNYDERGKDWEKNIHLTFIEPSGKTGFSVDAGIRLHGGSTRKHAQKNFKVYFRDIYGIDELNYPIFAEQPHISYKSLIIRNGGSDWNQSYMRDVFVQSILRGFSDVATQANRPVIVFLNGEYYGVMQLKERYDKHYIEQHYNEIDFDLLRDSGKIVYGSNKKFMELMNFIKEKDITNYENYEYVKSKINIENIIDFYILQVFSMNTDQPGKNVYYWKSDNDESKWQFMFYDMDDTFGFGTHNNYDRNGLIYTTGLNNINSKKINEATPPPAWATNSPNRTFLLRVLLQNLDFRNEFINRFADLLNTAFLPEYLIKKIDSIYYQTNKYMYEQYRRWHRPTPTALKEHYLILHDFAKNRTFYQRKHIKDFFNIKNDYVVELNVSDCSFGYIMINSIKINKTLPILKNNPYPWKGIYFEEIPIEIKAISEKNCIFLYWNNDKTDTISTKIITLHQNIKLTANFKRI